MTVRFDHDGNPLSESGRVLVGRPVSRLSRRPSELPRPSAARPRSGHSSVTQIRQSGGMSALSDRLGPDSAHLIAEELLGMTPAELPSDFGQCAIQHQASSQGQYAAAGSAWDDGSPESASHAESVINLILSGAPPSQVNAEIMRVRRARRNRPIVRVGPGYAPAEPTRAPRQTSISLDPKGELDS